MHNTKSLIETALTHAGFGGFPKSYVWRDHLVKTIDDLFSPEIDVVQLEGRSGIGLTSLAAEYALHSDACVIALFIRGGSRLSYAPFRLATDLLAQADSYLGSDSSSLADVVSGWHGRFAQLQEFQRRQGKRILFVVDGLHQIPAEDSRFVSEIYKDLLAVGVPGVKHLITLGEKTSLGQNLQAVRGRPYRASRLSLSEAEIVFSSVAVPSDRLKEYYSYTDGIPALVQSACRLHSQGRSLDGLSKELSSFYAAEWDYFLSIEDLPTDNLTDALAFLCFGKGAVGIQELTEICRLQQEDLLILGDREIFVRTVNERSGVEFLSHSHREFVAAKLSSRKDSVINLMIDRLLVKPHSETSLALLPTFYEELGRVDDLIDYLSPENLGRYLDYSRSATALRRRTELGMKRAMDGAKHVQSYQFALQTSLIRSMDVPRLSPEQMGALAGLGEIDQAFAHSQLARTDEERLKLLSILVRELYRGGIAIPNTVEEQIRLLVSKTDLASGGNGAISIATNLVGAFPELALQIVEGSDHADTESREAAIAQLAVNDVVRAKIEDRKPSSFAAKLKNTELEGFVVMLQAVLLTRSVEELDATTKKLATKERSYLLRQWAIANRLTKDAYRVIELALSDFVKDASYLPTAGDLWELCATLASCTDTGVLDALVKRIEGFKGSLSQAGSSIDLIGLDLELAVAQALSVSVASSDRFEDIYIRVADLPDASLRMEGYGLILAALARAGKGVYLNHAEAVKEAVEKELPPLLDVLLSQTADHSLVFEPALNVFLKIDPRFAIRLVERFNTEERRDDGFATLADAYVRQSTIAVDFHLLRQMMLSICGRGTREDVFVSVLKVLRVNTKMRGDGFGRLLDDVANVRNPVLRCAALAHAVDIDFSAGARVDYYFHQLTLALKEIDRSPSRPREAYRFVQAVVKHDKSEGLRIYRAVEKELSAYRMTSQSTLSTSYLCARAAVISFGALLEKQAYTEEYLGRLISAIEAVPSISMRTNLFADLALRAHQKKAKDVFEKICSKQIYPALANVNPSHLDTRENLTCEAFASIYLWNQSLAIEFLNSCELASKELALGYAIDYVVMGTSPNEPTKTEKLAQFVLDYPRALQAVNLISMLETDATIAGKIECFCRVLSNKGSRNIVTGHQRSSLIQSLLSFVDRKLPDPRNIQHQGWLILCRAYATLPDADISVWERFSIEAESVPNISDRVYVFGSLSQVMPEKYLALRRATLNKAKDALNLIPSDADAMVRRISLSDVAGGFEKTVAERLLRDALEDSLKIKDRDTALTIQKKIIDTAQQFDKALAEKLVDRLDDDPARSRAKAELRQDAKAVKRKEAISEGDYGLLTGESAEPVNRACFDALASLNIGKISPPKLDELTPLLLHTSAFAIRDVYWGYAWFLRGCQQRLQSTEDVNRILRPIFEVTLLSCELAQRMSDGADPTLLWEDGAEPDGIVVGPSDRLDAISFLTSWFGNSCGDEVLICDPYFTIHDLELIKSFHYEKPSAKFTILSCKSSALNSVRDTSNLEAAWAEICEQAPPEIRLIVVLYEGEGVGGPIHDRWILCRQAGLRIGTSLNSLGLSKLSEISAVNEAEIPALLSKLNRFVLQQDRTVDGRRLRYLSETL